MKERGKEGELLAGWEIREARLADAAAIARLVGALGYATTTEEMRERLGVIFARAEYITFVAESPDGIVGMVGAYVGHAFEFDAPYGRLTGLAVEEGWRRRGIGRLLMQQMEDWLRGRGAKVLILTSGRPISRFCAPACGLIRPSSRALSKPLSPWMKANIRAW